MTATQNTDYKLGEISGKIDLVLVQMAADRTAANERFAKIEARQEATDDEVAGLKRDRAWVLGGAATLSALGAAVAGLFGFGK